MSTALRTYYRGAKLVSLRETPAAVPATTRVYHFDHQGTTQCPPTVAQVPSPTATAPMLGVCKYSAPAPASTGTGMSDCSPMISPS